MVLRNIDKYKYVSVNLESLIPDIIEMLWKIANIVAFSSRTPYATKYSPFIELHCTHNFSSFVFYKS